MKHNQLGIIDGKAKQVAAVAGPQRPTGGPDGLVDGPDAVGRRACVQLSGQAEERAGSDEGEHSLAVKVFQRSVDEVPVSYLLVTENRGRDTIGRLRGRIDKAKPVPAR